MPQTIKARECRFAIHIPSKTPDEPDYHLVKEQCHYEDGTQGPNVTLVKDFKRPFYITRPNRRTSFWNEFAFLRW